MRALLAQAEADLARGDFAQAQRHAEKLLEQEPPRVMRARALLVAADAAAGLRLHRVAAGRYAEILARHAASPEAPPAALGLGLAHQRQGDLQPARQAWTRLGDVYPADRRAPLALALAAEVASETGDLPGALALLDRLIARHPRTPQAQGARMTRAILLVRQQREDEAVRELDALVQGDGVAALAERGRLLASLQTPPSGAAVAALPRSVATNGNGGNGNGGHGAAAGGHDRLEHFAAAFLDTRDRANAPYVLHGLVVLGATKRGWLDPTVTTLARRLVDEFPTYPPAVPMLARVGAVAISMGRWPIARQAYESLLARAPATPVAESARVDLAEALLRTGDAAAARQQLAARSVRGADTARALLLQVEVSEALGDRRGALSAYDRLLVEHPRLARSSPSLMAHARLLEDTGEPARAGVLLKRVMDQASGEVAAEAAYRLARIHGAAGQHQAAAEWYLTAAYAVEGSRWTRPALLGAGESMAAMNETKEALAIYQTLVLSRAGIERAEDREVSAEAAYRAGELLRGAGRHEDALDMYQRSARLSAGSRLEGRALTGAAASLEATGNHAQAEVVRRRLQESGARD
jgi:tetratricopeptide (TPR) repeat protein